MKNQVDKNNICLITGSFEGGGAERVIVLLANYFFQSLENNCSIVCLNASGPNKDLVNKNITIHNLNQRLRNSIPEFIKLLKSSKKFTHIIVGYYTLSLPIIISTLILSYKTRIIVCESNPLSFKRLGFFKLIFGIITRLISYRLIDKVVANSEDTKNSITRFNFLNKRNLVVIPNPVIDSSSYYKSKKILTKITHEPKLLSIGRLTHQKNYELLIMSIKKLNINYNLNCSLTIYGEGENRIDLERLIESLNMNGKVNLVGYNSDLNNLIHQYDLYIQSSRWEGLGNAIVEAINCGLTPVITEDCKGSLDVINLLPKRYIAKSTIESLSETIFKALNDPIEVNELRNAIYRYRTVISGPRFIE